MKNMVETTAGPNLAMKAIFAICAFVLAVVLTPVGTAHAATAPTLAEGTAWYTSSTDKSTYTTINIVDSYSPTGSERESWDISATQDGSAKAYVSADGTTLTLAGNGSGSLKTNYHSSGFFEGFSSVTTINGLSLLDTSGSVWLGGFFEGDASLTSVEGIEGWDVSACERFEAMFFGCVNLTSIDLSQWNINSATDMSSLFKHCESLVDLQVPTTKAPNLYHIAFAFEWCTSLEHVDVSFMDSGKLRLLDGLFDNCSSLKSITGYETLVTSEASEITYIFNSCGDLQYLDLSQWDVSGAESLAGMFAYTYDIQAIDGLENWDVSNAEDIHRMFLQSGITNLDGVCGWDVSNVIYFQDLFGLADITSLDLSAWNTSSAEDMNGMFDLCLDLTEVKFGPGFTTENVVNFERMFADCDSIEVLDISMFDTGTATNMTEFFDGMDTLQVVTLGENFSFTGDGTASCVLPTPDPRYIPDATGNWQAVANGTVDEPAGAVYAPADVPSKVAETYVMEVPKVPVLAASQTWYMGSTVKSSIVTINIVDSYTPTGSEKESWDASAEQNGSVMAYVSGDGKTLTIAGNGYGSIMANKDSSFAFDGFSSATAINGSELLDTTETTRMDCMFSDCEVLKSLNLDGWDVSNVYMFNLFAQNCYALTSFGPNNLRDWDTSAAEHFSNAFDNCESLEALDVSGWDVSSCEVFNYMFSNCKSLQVLDVSTWNPSSATKMACTFQNCESLTTLDFANWNTPSLADASGFLWGCTFSSIDVSGLDLGLCTDIANFFYNCKNLKNIEGINSWDTGSVKLAFDVFANCKSLTELDLSNWATPNMTNCGSMFSGCESLKILNISGFDTSKASVSSMFNKCYRLQQVTLGEKFSFTGNGSTSCVLPTPDPEYITGATGKWQAVANGTVDEPAGAVYAPADVPSNVAETYVMEVPRIPVLAANSSWYAGSTAKSAIVAINIVDSYEPSGSEKESWDASAEQNGSVMAYVSADGTILTVAGNGSGYIMANADSSCAFADFTAVTGIEGLELLDTSNTTVLTDLFEYDALLTSVSGIEDWDVSKCTHFGSIFNSCESLTSIDISNWDVSSATTMRATFAGCHALTNLDVPTIKAENLEETYHTFYECKALENLDVSFMASGKIKNALGMFHACESLKTLTGYETLVTAATEDFSYIFNCCYNLVYLDVSKWDTSNADDLQYVFYNLLDCTTIDGLENWDVSKVTNMTGTFTACSAESLDGISGWDVSKVKWFSYTLSSTEDPTLDLSSWNTASAIDMQLLFEDCYNLKSLTLGDGFTTQNVTNFKEMFKNCYSLKTLDISMLDTTSATTMTDFFLDMWVLEQVTLGEKFSFTGNGSTSCVLPTPDPDYIPGAIGKWQAVGAGTVEKPAGTIYLPGDVPSNVFETYVMPLTTISVDVPVKVTLAASADGTWCTPTATANKIINHSYAPVSVVSAEASSVDGFTMLTAANVASSTASNVFGGTITAGAGNAQDLTTISTSEDVWTMAAETDSDDSDLISLQLAGSIGNVEGTYFTEGAQLFDITYTFELAL